MASPFAWTAKNPGDRGGPNGSLQPGPPLSQGRCAPEYSTPIPIGSGCPCGAQAGWQPIGWDEALDEVAEKLKRVQAQHGVNSAAIYLGNPNVHNLGSVWSALPSFVRCAPRTGFRLLPWTSCPIIWPPISCLATSFCCRFPMWIAPMIGSSWRKPAGLEWQPADRWRHRAAAQGHPAARRAGRGGGFQAHRNRRRSRRTPFHPTRR